MSGMFSFEAMIGSIRAKGVVQRPALAFLFIRLVFARDKASSR